jgi:hypothetical protein
MPAISTQPTPTSMSPPVPLARNESVLTDVVTAVARGPHVYPIRKFANVPFPLTYTCDMVRGIRELLDVHGEDNLAAIFPRFFPGSKYAKSTFNMARNIYWRAFMHNPELIEEHIGYGRTANGFWKRFREAVDGSYTRASSIKNS